MQERMRFVLALGLLLLSGTVAINLLLEDAPVVIQLEGDTFKVVDIPYVYTLKEAYILLFSGFFGGLALSRLLAAFGISFFEPPNFRAGEYFGTGEQLAAGSPSSNFSGNVAGNVAGNAAGNAAENPAGEKRPFCLEEEQAGEFEPQATMPDKSDSEAEKALPDPTSVLLKALEGDERRAVELIVERGGRILQNELVNSLNFSRAKVSRILANLERRGIVSKRKYGLTNCISIAEEIKGRPCPEGVSDEE